MKKLTKKAQKELLKSDGTLKLLYRNAIIDFATSTKIYPKQYRGSGRYITLRDASSYITYPLELLGYKYTLGNDAPRGGKEGDYIKISKTALKSLRGLLKHKIKV